ncbi:hypothetical protein B0H21DRAFT_686182 [Amylocystis lapponica]|nr:hypothetical protein B0H21DRAFT_686182 [Amylocystis lapponica]
MEVAQDIAEEVMRLSRSSEPVSTDVPLMLVGLNSITVVQLHFWLQATYDYEEDMVRLFEEDITAESIARDIIVAEQDVPTVVVDAPEQPVDVVRLAPAPKRSRLTPKAPLSVKVVDAHVVDRQPADVPIPVTAIPYTASKEVAPSSPFDIGMAPFESWTGKKGGIESTLMYSLLALGILGSPMTPSFGTGSTFDVRGMSTPTLARAPASARTPVLSPWLDSVRLSVMESVQSPWASGCAHSSFPQSPVCF